MTDQLATGSRHLLATARAIHRAVDFLETKNVKAYRRAMAIAACEPDRFQRDEEYAQAYEAGEAHATVVAEMEELENAALDLANAANDSGRPTVAAQLTGAVQAAMQFRYAPVVDAGVLARKAADRAMDAANTLAK